MATTATKATRNQKSESVSSSDLENDMRQLRADMAQLVEHLKGLGTQSGKTARRAAGEKVEQLRDQGEAALQSVSESAQDLEREFTRTVRERPLTALALAAGAGFFIALATRR